MVTANISCLKSYCSIRIFGARDSLLILTIVLFCSGCAEDEVVHQDLREQSDFILIDGKVITSNPDQPIAEAFVVQDGHFSFIGSSEDARQHAPHLLVLDASGKTILPGLIDSHTHPGMIGFLGEDDEEAPVPKTSHGDILAWLDNYVTWHSGPVIQAGEWPTILYGVEGPHKSELDKIVKWRAVMLFDDSGHSQWLNSSALKLLGIDKETPDPAPGLSYFVRDKNGEATGWVKEFALVPYIGDALLPDRKDIKRRMSEFLDFLSSKGVTTLFDAGNLLFHEEIYEIVAELEKEGRLPLRYFGSIHIVLPSQIESAIAELKDLRADYESDLIKFETIKIHFDGVQEIRTAAMLDPYIGKNAGRGRTLFTEDELTLFVLELHREQIDLHLHTVGDRAIRIALNAAQRAQVEVDGPLDCLISLSHLEILSEADAARFAELGIVANFTPHWSGGYFQGAHLTSGPPRSENMYRAMPIFKSGGVVSFSSDTTTYTEMIRANPFYGMQVGHNRQEVDGGNGAVILPPKKERLDLDQLVQGYTIGGATQLGQEGDLGSIEVDKLADFLTLKEDLFSVDRYEIHTLEPDLVVVNGRVMHGEFGFSEE
tara:strand:- start:5815 stop:7614 length:1800 start_codon:yes stop_codon:yes gene_type:complete